METNEPISKRVRFPANMEQVREVQVIKDKSCWYSTDDFATFRRLARESCEQAYDQSPSKALHIINKKHCKQSDMDYWSLHRQSDRGLESLANPLLGRVRKKLRSRCIKSVMIAQTVSREQEAAGQDIDVERFIAYISATESFKTKKFAFMMGKADEKAIGQPQPIQRPGSHIGKSDKKKIGRPEPIQRRGSRIGKADEKAIDRPRSSKRRGSHIAAPSA
jgi:hypothetical protein